MHTQLLTYFLLFSMLSVYSQSSIMSVYKIWDGADHNAFTDIIRYEGKFYTTFREGSGHVPWPAGIDGTIRVLVSEDGRKWESFASLAKEGYDLRDSKLSITPWGQLMLIIGGSDYDHTNEYKLNGRLTHVSFLDNKTSTFSKPEPTRIDPSIKSDFDWLWRVTWHQGWGYGVVYRKKDKTKSELFLVKTRNGIDYELVTSLDVKGIPGECSVSFQPNGEMLIIIRRDEPNNNMGYLAKAKSPYKEFTFIDTGMRLGGPQILHYRDNLFVMGTRSFLYDKDPHTSLFLLKPDATSRCICELPSRGDNSYPGMLFYDNKLWVSYYSSHEGKSSIYLATIPLSFIEGNNW